MSFPTPFRSSFGIAIVGKKAYILGGHQGEYHNYQAQHFSDAFQSYDLQTGKTDDLEPFPFLVQGIRIIPFGDYIYAFGGFRYEPGLDYGPGVVRFDWFARSSDAVTRYSISHNKWERIGEMVRRRSSYVAEQLNGRVYLIGGWDGTPRIKDDIRGRFHWTIDVFDLATETFVPSDFVLPSPTRRAFTSAVLGNKIAVAGGLLPSGFHDYDQPVPSSNTDTVALFDPSLESAKAWTKVKQSLPDALFSPGMCAVGGALVVAGGLIGQMGPMLDTIQVFEAGAWREAKAHLSQPVMFPELLPVGGDSIRVLGGHGFQDPLGLDEVISIA